MASPYDTTPHGDFVRYIEQLTRPQAPASTPATASRRPARAPRPVARPAVASTFAPLRQVVQGALFLFVAWLLVSSALPLLAAWGGLVGLAYLVFAFLRLRHLPWGELLKQTR